MPRVLPQAFRAALEAPASSEFELVFVTITHPSLSVPARFVRDTVDRLKNGDYYFATWFTFAWLTDTAEAPEARIQIPNVDRRIGEALFPLVSRPRLKIEVCYSAGWYSTIKRGALVLDFARKDYVASEEDRTFIAHGGTIVPAFSADFLYLEDVSADPMTIDARIVAADPGAEPWPAVRATMDVTPGLYRS